MKHGLLIGSACLLALLSTIGASLAYPLLPPLFSDTAPNALNSFGGLPPKLLFGIALMVNPVGMLLGSAVLGSLSDAIGRRRMLLLTTIGAAAGHLLTAYALSKGSYALLVAARFVTGILEGNGAILRALLAERLAGGLRNHALSWLNGASNLGWLAGPLLSGLSAAHSITLPFYLAAGGLLLGAVLSLLVLQPQAPARAPQLVGAGPQASRLHPAAPRAAAHPVPDPSCLLLRRGRLLRILPALAGRGGRLRRGRHRLRQHGHVRRDDLHCPVRGPRLRGRCAPAG